MVAPAPDVLTVPARWDNRARRIAAVARWVTEMPHLHLPAQHSDEDLALAGCLAEMLSSEDLYVAWSLESGPAKPAVEAAIREPRPAAEPLPARRRTRRRSLVVVLLDAIVARSAARQRAV